MTPLDLNVLIECCTSVEPGCNWYPEHWDSWAAQVTRTEFRLQGVIDDNNKATEKGKAWLEFICQTPMPIQEWKLPENEEVLCS